jgi:hypothetical protein
VSAPAPARSRPPAKAAAPAAQLESDRDTGEGPRSLRHYLGDIRVHDPRVLDARVHFPGRLATPGPGRAVTHAGAVHLSADAASLSGPRLERLLVHEAIHVAQQLDGGGAAPPAEAEVEAQQLAAGSPAGVVAAPRLRTDPHAVLGDTPRRQGVVERARQRKALLERYLAEWGVRNVRQLSTARERDPMLAARVALDRGMSVIVPPEVYAQTEEAHLAKLNRRPLRIEVTSSVVRFHVKFQVRFEGLSDRDASTRFPALKSSLESGIQTVWTQSLRGPVFAGRDFELVPRIELVSAGAPRNLDFWLVSVRPSDTGPLEFEGQSLGTSTPGLSTSVTDPNVGGGVMSIPPSHATQPVTLGHETLHLFGLVDRYVSIASPGPGGKMVNVNSPLRKTGGRPDPLATQSGTILREDLTFLFDRLGVYQMEENRALDTLRQLEAQGMDQAMATVELHRQEEIIRLGYDPRVMVPERRSFMKELIESVDEL